MAYDGILMRACIHELNETLAGGRVDRVMQPNSHEIILQIRHQAKTHKLLLSALAQEARVQLTQSAPPNPEKPPLFCMVLRKHLENSRVLAFQQAGLDRILTIRFQVLDEMGDLTERLLVAEIMGKHSNLILLEPPKEQKEAETTDSSLPAGRIIDSLTRIPASVSRYRQVLPGETYVLPPSQHKLPLWLETAEELPSRLLAAGESKPLDKIILQAYDGLGPLSAQELISRAGFSPVDTLEYFGQSEYLRLFEAVHNLGQALVSHSYTPEIFYKDGKPKDFSAIALTQFPPESRRQAPSVNGLLEDFYKNRGLINFFRQRQADLEQLVRREQERCQKKAGLQAASIQEASEAEAWQLYGQLLMANHYRLHPGREAIVEDYTKEGAPQVCIPLDPRLSVIENAQVFFNRYQKARSTAEKARIHYEETLGELEYLDSLANSLTTVTTLAELAEIRSELKEAGYVKSEGQRGPGRDSRNAKGPSGGPGKPGKGKYKTPPAKKTPGKSGGSRDEGLTLGREEIDGFEVLYGKNNRQNDYLTMKLARPGDLWLHTQKIPSSHVIIRNPEKRPLPEKVIEAAARICLAHSQARASGANVDYTQRQNVWKPKGAKPGMVLYENYQTLYLRAEE